MSEKTIAQQQVDALLAEGRRGYYPECSSCGEDLIPHDGELCGVCAGKVLALLSEARAWMDKHRCCTEERCAEGNVSKICDVCGREKLPPCPHLAVKAGSMRCLDCGHMLRGGEPTFPRREAPANPCKADLACYRLGYERLLREREYVRIQPAPRSGT